MKNKWYYDDFQVELTPEYGLGELMAEEGNEYLECAKIVSVTQEGETKYGYNYRFIFKIPKS